MSSGFKECPMNKSDDANVEYNIWEDEKTNKDETNRNRQSFPHITCEETFHCRSYIDKSMEGKWKRKKGPAPPCPIPHRRKVSRNLFIYFTSVVASVTSDDRNCKLRRSCKSKRESRNSVIPRI